MASGFQIKPTDAEHSTFHVTTHGIRDVPVFPTDRAKSDLLGRIRNHLSPLPTFDASRRPHTKLFDEVVVLAFCILDNHLHLVLHQFSAAGIEKLMGRVLASYAREFNRQMNWRGPVFDGRYAAKHVDALDADYLKNMIAYVELNDPIQQFDNPFGSHSVISGDRAGSSMDQERTLAIFDGIDGYRDHMNRIGPSMVGRKIERLGLDPKEFPYRPI